ncbi:MAG TPA: hypothetical protein P5528_16265, partial [Steroidobacteraceae bacterium]|nr:hypothetical protein [Steroidobacteraceae bacterium]
QGKHAMSQCSYSLANFGQLTLQLTRSGKPIGVSRQADADRERARDDGTGFGVAMADAIESGADLPGLGSLAYQYRNDDAMHLVAYWDKHYSAWLWMNSDAAGEARVTQIEQDVARAVIQRLQAKQ